LDFLFYGGLRALELVNIRHQDYQDNSLRIHGKGNKVRYVFLPPFLVEHFKLGSREYLFKISTSQIRSITYRRAKLAGINK
jgi:integrase